MTSSASSLLGGSGAQSALDEVVEAMLETLSMAQGMTSVRPCGLAPNGSVTGVGVSFTGWSAAMRRQKMEWHLSAPTGPMPDGSEPTREFLGDALAMEYGPHIVLQAQRARIAQEHGLGTYEDERLSPNHFMIDRSVAKLLAGARIDPGTLVTWHRRNSTDEGVRRSVNSTGAHPNSRLTIPTVTIATMPDGEGVLLAPAIVISRPNQTVATLRDRQLAVHALLPESVLVAAIGRRLGDIVETGIAHLDDRHIDEAGTSHGVSMLILERQRMSVSEAQSEAASAKWPLASGPGRRGAV